MELSTPTRFSTRFMVIGMVALLDEVLKANNMAGHIFLMRVASLCPYLVLSFSQRSARAYYVFRLSIIRYHG